MMRALVFLLLLLGANAQLPRIHSIGGIEAADLFTAPADITDDYSPWGPALGSDLQKPQSHRTIYTCFSGPSIAAGTGLAQFPQLSTGGSGVGLNTNLLRISLVAIPTLTTTLGVKLEHPYLEIDPYGCPAAAGGANGDCRCNPALVNPALSIYSISTDQPTVTFGTTSPYANYIIPTATYFEHAPYPGQSPYMRTYQKLCIQPPSAAYTWYLDTTVWIAVTKCCVQDTDCTRTPMAFSFTALTAATAPVYTVNPFGPASYLYASLSDTTNNNLPANWVCNRQGYLGAFFQYNVNSAPVAVTPGSSPVEGECWGETMEMTLARFNRTKCCGAQVPSSIYSQDWLGITSVQQKFGTCIDPSVDACCGWKPFNPFFEQCCSRYHGRINNVDQPCKCSSETEAWDCGIYGGNTWTSADLGVANRGETAVNALTPVSTGRYCCVNVKYPEMMGSNILNVAMRVPRYGFCYSISDPLYRCCDDGNIYDIGSQQCCVINGVQSLNTPCPCSDDTHCNGLASPYLIQRGLLRMNQQCCIQQFPKSWPDGQMPIPGISLAFAQLPTCNTYANWPDGTGPAENQRCVGNCIDTRFQTCCNGHICVRKYERCCNSTCCNRFTSGCMEGTRAGSLGYGSRWNPVDYSVSYESCTSIEVLTTRRAFWVWVMPTFWVLATAISFAIVTVVARRATENSFPLTERCMVFFAVFLAGLCVPHYFAPTYKYGIVIVFGSIFTIVGAVMQSRRMSLLTIFVVIGMLVLWIDPFNGNLYLSLPGGSSPVTQVNSALNGLGVQNNFYVGNNPLPLGDVLNYAVGVIYNAPNLLGGVTSVYPLNRYYSGILEALFDLERNRIQCTGFYDYFTLDPYIRDMVRLLNPAKTTFGFCTRAWMTTLLIFSCVSLALILVLLMLSIFSYAKKVVPKSYHEDTAYPLPMDAQAPYA